MNEVLTTTLKAVKLVSADGEKVCCCRLVVAGVDLPTVKELLGH